jgi:large subunit ribosomal protein L23
MTPEQIIRRPIALTEKATRQKAEHNQVVFEVDLKANKIQIREAVERLFDVKVVAVNTMIFRGKLRRTRRQIVQRPNWKKAVVTLREGDDIQFFYEAEDAAAKTPSEE